jgi:hypothetical protein
VAALLIIEVVRALQIKTGGSRVVESLAPLFPFLVNSVSSSAKVQLSTLFFLKSISEQ